MSERLSHQPAAGVLGPVRAHHVSIAVTDMDRALRFWTEIFGFTLLFRFDVAAIKGKGAFVEGGGIRLELWRLAETAAVPDYRRQPNTDLLTAGTKHIAFRVDDVQAAIDALHARDVPIVAVQRDRTEPMRAEADPTSAAGDRTAFAAFIHDPFGTLIEILGPAAD
jgi:methylmalonyl-CoA/ethylmalonyl-CoA epimerase